MDWMLTGIHRRTHIHTHTACRQALGLEKTRGIFPYCLCSGCPRFQWLSQCNSAIIRALLSGEMEWESREGKCRGRSTVLKRKAGLVFFSHSVSLLSVKYSTLSHYVLIRSLSVLCTILYFNLAFDFGLYTQSTTCVVSEWFDKNEKEMWNWQWRLTML